MYDFSMNFGAFLEIFIVEIYSC